MTSFVNLAYLVAAALFILGLREMSHPRTAVRGNLLGAAGMLLAILVTLLDRRIVAFEVIIAGLAVGSLAGGVLALRVPMTAMPQMVGLLNGFGGGASLLVAAAALDEATLGGGTVTAQFTVAAAASGLIGAVTFWGSLVAFAKLQGLVQERPTLLPGRHIINAALTAASLGVSAWLVADPSAFLPYWVLVAVASVLGLLLVIPIGGADMPVVISLLNSYSGLAAAATGFVLDNNMLIIAGSLVGAAGFILTTIMCRAMNRSVANVLFGGVGAVATATTGGDDIYAGRVKAATAEEVAMLLDGARRVVVVPGFGMAVSQAQYAVRDLARALESRGVEVEFAIHPVAGRMPGHMNVLLAEADIPYDKLKEMDVINPTFPQTDAVLVIGANDVVNPVARNTSDASNPIAGMPILNVDQARTVVVIKRSLSPGFAGIPNPLFAADNTLMLFGDARKMVQDLVAALKET
ncbi:MAG: NAD(P)(+) transhydrogenase (Re/Si-specific) subunit beta [Chloroflexi bacterium]|nr:NAD(P)(+) transhydrogenase (Re/Si-specific) subunit beta [Chloroflexota bacterium]